MFYRRKLMLVLLYEFGGKLNRLDFQKYLFLLSVTQPEPKYHFVPYKFGCFSFQSYADKNALIHYKYLVDGQDWELRKFDRKLLYELDEVDLQGIRSVKKEFGGLTRKKLLRKLYIEYPYYAINSEIIEEVLSSEEREVVEAAHPRGRGCKLYTIGYEGISIEEYLNKLIKSDIKVLCDVRKNPLSRKFGFSKNQLSGAVEKVGIKYIHFPALGIESKFRANLDEMSDYERLFKKYAKHTIPKQQEFIEQIIDLVETEKRVAITCYEASPQMCHRSCVSAAIVKSPRWSYKVEDL